MPNRRDAEVSLDGLRTAREHRLLRVGLLLPPLCGGISAVFAPTRKPFHYFLSLASTSAFSSPKVASRRHLDVLTCTLLTIVGDEGTREVDNPRHSRAGMVR